MESSAQKTPFLAHLSELRKRLLWIIAIFILGIIAAAPFSEQIFNFLSQPVLPYLKAHNTQFVTLSLTEGWNVYMKTAIVGGIFFTAPLWLYQIWAFVAPALARQEKRTILITTFFSLICFLLGASFCYYFMMPVGFDFMIAILGPNIIITPQMQSYLSLALWLILAFGLVFQVPILLVHLVRWNVVSLQTLKKTRRHMIVVAFIVGAVLTPPDIVSQACLSIPLILLYELSLLIARYVQPQMLKGTEEAKNSLAA